MRQRSFFAQALTTLGVQQFGIVITLAIGVITARFLGADGKGYIAMLAAPVALITAFGEFGVRQSVAYLIGKKAYTQLEIQSNVLGIFFATGGVALLATVIAYYSLGLLTENPAPALIYALVAPMILLRRYAGGILLGKQQIGRINSVDFMDRATVFSVMLVGFFLLGGQLPIAVSATVAGATVSTVTVLLFIRNSGVMRPRWKREIAVLILKRGMTYAASLFFITSTSKAGVLLTGTFGTTADAGLYSVGAGVSELVRQLPLSVGLVLLARSISWKVETAGKKLDDVSALTRILFPLALGFGLFLTLLAIFLVPLVYGREFSEAYIVTAIQAPAEAVLAVVLLLHFFASGQGKPSLATVSFAAALGVTLLVGASLISSIGYIGASVAVDLGYLVGTVIYLFVFSREFDVSIRQLILPRPSDLTFFWRKIRLKE